MQEVQISRETAEREFQKIVDYYEIEEFDREDQQDLFDQSKSKLVKAIQKNRLKIDDENGLKITQTTKSGENLEYREIDGRAKQAMSKAKEGDHAGKMYAMLGSLCGGGPDLIMKLKGPDLSTAESLGAVFLSV